MNNVTKMKILKPVNEVYEAFLDPDKIGKFWFSSSSERWQAGKTITLTYNEYNAQVNIKVLEVCENRKIVFEWGTNEKGHLVTITINKLSESESIIEINEEGFNENDDNFINEILDNKEGWVYMLTCLKGYLEFEADIRASLVK